MKMLLSLKRIILSGTCTQPAKKKIRKSYLAKFANEEREEKAI